MKKAILIVGLLVLAVVNSFAQTQVEPLSSFKVGDVVYYGYENNGPSFVSPRSTSLYFRLFVLTDTKRGSRPHLAALFRARKVTSDS